MKPTRPGLAMPAAKVAFIPLTGFMMPRQLGPTTRMPYCAGRLEDLPLQLHALRPDLLEAGADDDHALDARLAALRHEARGALGRRHDDREVDGLADGADGRVGLHAEDGRAGWG